MAERTPARLKQKAPSFVPPSNVNVHMVTSTSHRLAPLVADQRALSSEARGSLAPLLTHGARPPHSLVSVDGGNENLLTSRIGIQAVHGSKETPRRRQLGDNHCQRARAVVSRAVMATEIWGGGGGER